MNEILNELLIYEAKEIELFFEKARLEGKGTPQEVSDRREDIVKKLIEKYFPAQHRVAKGNIRDSFGMDSASIDCILLNPCHPKTTNTHDRYSIILADGVDAAIEVKPDFASEAEIERSLKQVATVKMLKRVKRGVISPVSSVHSFTERIPCFIFSNVTYKDPRLLISKIADYYIRNKIPRYQWFDYIVINNWGMILNSSDQGYFKVNSKDRGLFFSEQGNLAIRYFLYFLDQVPKAEIQLGSSVLSHYLNFENLDMRMFNDINACLTSL